MISIILMHVSTEIDVGTYIRIHNMLLPLAQTVIDYAKTLSKQCQHNDDLPVVVHTHTHTYVRTYCTHTHDWFQVPVSCVLHCGT